MKIFNSPIALPAVLTAILLTGCRNGDKKASGTEQPAKAIGNTDTTAMIRNLEAAFSKQRDISSGLKLANLYAETKDRKALVLCDALLAKDSTRELTDAVFIKGIYYLNTSDTVTALRQFDECINRDWKFTEAYFEKGRIQYNRNDFDNALKTFELAVQVANTYPDTYYWLGKCQEALGDKQQAITNYYRALALDKDFKEAQQAINRLSQ